MKRIVIIDDNKIDCFINQKMITLTHKNVVTKIFNSAIEALDYFTNTAKEAESTTLLNIDLILLDINMPVMSGFEFLNKLTKLRVFIENPVDVFFLSSSNCDTDISEALNTKYCSGYINKPLTREKINNLLVSQNKMDTEVKLRKII